MEIPDSYYSKDEYVETVSKMQHCIDCNSSQNHLKLDDLISFT